ncbi:MAG: PEP-CTERM sorting domain-containing protein [Burkholderiales bacterium]|nr:PEP-CTERM sorting domain-containing protein [Burkholderiales bacterium]
MPTRRLLACIGFAATLLHGAPTLAMPISSSYVWTAASGLLPDQVDARMALTDTATPEAPVLSGGVLTIATSSNPEFLFYSQGGTDLVVPATLTIEATMRLGAGSSSQTGTTAPRSYASIVFLTATSVGNALFFGPDRLFLLTGPDNLGPEVIVDTDDAFHDYVIRVSGSTIDVYQDSILVLSGSQFTGGIFSGVDARIAFGDGTLAAQGTSLWTRFAHNASASQVPEPATLFLALAALCGVAGSRGARRRALPPG